VNLSIVLLPRQFWKKVQEEEDQMIKMNRGAGISTYCPFPYSCPCVFVKNGTAFISFCLYSQN
jgi:hypothetical protein